MTRFHSRTLRAIACLLTLVLMLGIFPAAGQTPDELYLTAFDLDSPVTQHTKLQRQYLADTAVSAFSHAGAWTENSYPQPVTLRWSAEYTANGLHFGPYTVRVATNPELTDAAEYVTSNTQVDITNLLLGTTYYWQVSCDYNGRTYTSEVSSFTTDAAAPRNLKVDGVANVRDIGGWATADGGRVRQGMLIRCGRLNDNFSANVTITPSGIDVMVNELGIRSELDLRQDTVTGNGENGGLTESALGPGVNYYPLSFVSNGALSGMNKASTLALFDILADEDNYPMIFHCSIGTDRTGMVAFLVNALVGVNEADLMRDFFFSAFGKITQVRDISHVTKWWLPPILNTEGATLSEKVYRYLSGTVGVPTAQLDKVIAIMTDKAADQPVTPITTAEEFMAMAPDGRYRLDADLTLTGSYESAFTGFLDGDGHTITLSAPLFLDLEGTVTDLVLDGSIVSDGNAGALAVSGAQMRASGVVCFADVTSENGMAAGLAAVTNGTAAFVNCENYGTVTSALTAGGLVAEAAQDVSFSGCANYAPVTSSSAGDEVYTGGILGAGHALAFLEECCNYGPVTGAGAYTAGVAGYLCGEMTVNTLIACGNIGSVTGSGLYAAGVAGTLPSDAKNGHMSHSFNLGDVTLTGENAAAAAGLIADVVSDTAAVLRSYNAGSVTAEAGAALTAQLFVSSAAVSTGYVSENECLDTAGTPYYSLVGGTMTAGTTSTAKTAAARAFTASDLTDGTLIGKLNKAGTVFGPSALGPVTPNVTIRTGMDTVCGRVCGFDERGAYTGSYTGFYEAPYGLMYYENGLPVSGWLTVGEDTYWFDPDTHYAVTGIVTIDGSVYKFDYDGRLLGVFEGLSLDEDGELRCYVGGEAVYAGLVYDGDGYYYIGHDLTAVRGERHLVLAAKANGLVEQGYYDFDETGRMIVKNGLYRDADGEIRYYVMSRAQSVGLVQSESGDYYYINRDKKALRGTSYYVRENRTNGLLVPGWYEFDEDGKLIIKNGFVWDDDGKLRYYVMSQPQYLKLIEYNGDYYYFCHFKYAIADDTHFIIPSCTNGLMDYGTYAFDAEAHMILDRD